MSASWSVIGVDPGRSKVGYALVKECGGVVAAGIEQIDRLAERLRALLALHHVTAIALGRGTNSRIVAAAVQGLGIPVHFVDEYETSRDARALYFTEHPPRGWRRLLPIGLQLPPRPIDDYAAILIARRFLARGAATESPSY